MNSEAPTELLSPSDAAKVLGLTPAAVVAMAARGVLPVIRTVGGRRLFWRSDVERVVSERSAAASPRERPGR